MGPPPPRNPITTTATATTSDQSPSTETPTKTVDDMKKTSMGPPPPIALISEQEKSVQPNEPQLPEDAAAVATAGNSTADEEAGVSESKKGEQKLWSNVGGGLAVRIRFRRGVKGHDYFLEVLKDGSIIDQFDVHEKGACMFGRVDLYDVVLEHPTISRFHAEGKFGEVNPVGILFCNKLIDNLILKAAMGRS